MKLLAKQNISEGEVLPQKTVIAYGRSLTKYHTSDCQTLAEREEVKDKPKSDGWYVKVEIPFTRNLLHTNPDSFDQEVGPCRYMIRFRYRPANEHRDAIKYIIRGWFPV